MPDRPAAVLLDVGGVFLLPSRDHIRAALRQIGHHVDDDETIDRAHYHAVRAFPMDLEDSDFMGPIWDEYLRAYAAAVGVDKEDIEDSIEHLGNEFTTSGLWTELVKGSPQGLAALVATGVPVGVVSNSDGTIEDRLGEMAVLQVGPGRGVEIRCLIDSGSVGVEKPNPKIFDYALEAIGVDADRTWYIGDTPAFDVVGATRAGLKPILMDPFGVNGDFGVDTVSSLAEVARFVNS